MSLDLKSIYAIYFKPKALYVLLGSIVLSALVSFVYCRTVAHRYGMTALVKVAELDGGLSQKTAVVSNSLGIQAIDYLGFQYLSRSRNAEGVRLTEVKELKDQGTLQLAAEGPNMESIERFLNEILHDLQGKYKAVIDHSLDQGVQEVAFLNREIKSLEKLKVQVEDGIRNVGPAPALVSQMMEINQNLVKLKQDFFSKSGMISDERIHNFKLDTLRPLMEGAPVWPKTKQTVTFSMLVALFFSSVGLYVADCFNKKYWAKWVDEFRMVRDKSNQERDGSHMEILKHIFNQVANQGNNSVARVKSSGSIENQK
jgi:hypothetical protein